MALSWALNLRWSCQDPAPPTAPPVPVQAENAAAVVEPEPTGNTDPTGGSSDSGWDLSSDGGEK